MRKEKEDITFYATDPDKKISDNPFAAPEELILASGDGGEEETREGIERGKIKREVIEKSQKKELDRREAEKNIARLAKEVEDVRMKYVGKDYETANVVAKIKKLFGVRMESHGVDTVNAYHNEYKIKLTELLNLELDDLKSRGLGKEELKKEMGDLLKYFNFDEKLNLFDARTMAMAKAQKEKFADIFLRLSSRMTNGNKMEIGVADAQSGGTPDIEASVEAAPAESANYKIPNDYSMAVKFNLSELTNDNLGDWDIIKDMNAEKAKVELRPDLKERLLNLENKYINSIGSETQPFDWESVEEWVERLAKLAVGRVN